MTNGIDPRGAFDSDLAIIGVGPTTWKLATPLIWNGTQGDKFSVPLGFVTDFATVPRFLHWLVSPYGAYTRAAVLHDWLLVSLAEWSADLPLHSVGSGHAPAPPANSRDTDGIFRRVMQDLGVPFLTRWAMWTAVRWASLFNSRRAYGRNIAKDLPRMLAVSVPAIPLALPGVVGVLISLAVIRLLNMLVPERAREREA